MGSPLTHASIAILYHLFPENFNLAALLISSQIPDIEYPSHYFKSFLKNKGVIKAYLNIEQGFLHTLLGSLLINIPLSIFLTYLITNDLSISIVISAIIGVISHLLLDIPGHRSFILFYPKIIKKNPFKFKARIPLVEKFYPWKSKETVPDQVMAEYSWFVVSHVFVVLAIALYLIF